MVLREIAIPIVTKVSRAKIKRTPAANWLIFRDEFVPPIQKEKRVEQFQIPYFFSDTTITDLNVLPLAIQKWYYQQERVNYDVGWQPALNPVDGNVKEMDEAAQDYLTNKIKTYRDSETPLGFSSTYEYLMSDYWKENVGKGNWQKARTGVIGELLIHVLLEQVFPEIISLTKEETAEWNHVFRVSEDQDYYDSVNWFNERLILVCVKSSKKTASVQSSNSFIAATEKSLQMASRTVKFKDIVIYRFKVNFLDIEDPLGDKIYLKYARHTYKSQRRPIFR